MPGDLAVWAVDRKGGEKVVAPRQEPVAAMVPTEPVQSRARVTRRALLVAAATQFAEVGYHGTSLSEVIAASKVTKGALYFHFVSKQALADAVVAEMVEQWKVLVAGVNARGLDPLWTLLAQTDEVVARMMTDPITRGGIQLLTDRGMDCAGAAEHYAYGQAAATEQLTAAAAAGLLRPGVDPNRIARLVVVMMTGANLICDFSHDQLWEAVTELWQGLLPAIATDPWLERWQAADWPRRAIPVVTGLPEAPRRGG